MHAALRSLNDPNISNDDFIQAFMGKLPAEVEFGPPPSVRLALAMCSTMVAFARGTEAAVNKAIALGVDLEAIYQESIDGLQLRKTLLLDAALNGSATLVGALLHHGANPNARMMMSHDGYQAVAEFDAFQLANSRTPDDPSKASVQEVLASWRVRASVDDLLGVP